MQSELKSSLGLVWLLISQQIHKIIHNFVWYVLSDFTINEELLDLVIMRETTRGINIKYALDEALTRANVPLNKLVSVATDGAPTMVGKRVGLIVLMRCDSNFPEFLPIHCIIYREHLAAKYFKYEDGRRYKNCSRNSKLQTRKGEKITDNFKTLWKSCSKKMHPVMPLCTAL